MAHRRERLPKDMTYKTNPFLRKAGVEIGYTAEQIAEYKKCAADPMYFIRNYIWIINVDQGLILFDAYDYQERMVREFEANRFVICKMPRQSGKSVIVIGYMLHMLIFQDHINVAILANKGATARKLLARLALAYENLPPWLQQGVVTWNKGDLELENGSKIIADSTSADSIRGDSFNLVFLDEFAFVKNNMAHEFFMSVYPTISSGESTKVFIVSTPNGMNHFYKRWLDAVEERSDYQHVEIHWSETPGRDEEWKKMTIRNTSEEQFDQEFECNFIGSINTLISPMKLRNLAFVEPMLSINNLDIYAEPEENNIYTLIADSGHGVDQDYSAFTVYNITRLPYTIVAKYRSNTIPAMLYPSVIANCGEKYNDAAVLIELNDIGQQVADIIHYDLEYENLLYVEQKTKVGQRVSSGFGGGASKLQMGVKTSKQVKRIGCANLKDIIENDKLLVQDIDHIEEMSNFVAKGASYAADEGCHDDLVMNNVLFGWLVKQKYFEELTDINVREKLAEERMKAVEEDVMPFGFLDRGIEPNDDIWIEERDIYGNDMREYHDVPMFYG
jgi:hypothetical protein